MRIAALIFGGLAAAVVISCGRGDSGTTIVIYGANGTGADTLTVHKDSVSHDPIPCAIQVILHPPGFFPPGVDSGTPTPSGNYLMSTRRPC